MIVDWNFGEPQRSCSHKARRGRLLEADYSTAIFAPRGLLLERCSIRLSMTARIPFRNSIREFVKCSRVSGDRLSCSRSFLTDPDASLDPLSMRLLPSRRSPLILLVLCSPSNAHSREDRACHGRDSPQSGARSLRDRRLWQARVWRRPSHARTESAGAAPTIEVMAEGGAAANRSGQARSAAGNPADDRHGRYAFLLAPETPSRTSCS